MLDPGLVAAQVQNVITVLSGRERLQPIQAQYDPPNVLSLRVNIPPVAVWQKLSSASGNRDTLVVTRSAGKRTDGSRLPRQS